MTEWDNQKPSTIISTTINIMHVWIMFDSSVGGRGLLWALFLKIRLIWKIETQVLYGSVIVSEKVLSSKFTYGAFRN